MADYAPPRAPRLMLEVGLGDTLNAAPAQRVALGSAGERLPASETAELGHYALGVQLGATTRVVPSLNLSDFVSGGALTVQASPKNDAVLIGWTTPNELATADATGLVRFDCITQGD